jgi:hypothetical protein
LFYRATGGNWYGGFALPPIVEALWVTRSFLLAEAVLFVLYAVLGLFLRLLLRSGVFVLPLFISLFVPFVMSPEGVTAIFYTTFRAGVLAALLAIWIWRAPAPRQRYR